MADSRPMELPSDALQQDNRVLHGNLKRVSLGIFAVTALLTGFEILVTPPELSQAGIAAAMSGMALLSHLLIRQNRLRQVSALLVVAILVAGAWSMLDYGSARASASFTMVVAVVLAGAYLSRWAVIVTTLASVLILGALSWAQVHGLLAKPEFAMNARFLLASALYIGVMGAMLFHTRRFTETAYARRLHEMEDRLRVEFERDQSLRRFSRIFGLTPTALMIQSAGSQEVLEVNPAFERSLGLRREEVIGLPAGFLWVDDAQRRHHTEVLLEKGSTGWQRARWVRSDGQAIDLWVHSELSEARSGTLIITSVTV